jgi:serralysin
MATIGTAGVTGNADIDGLLVGARWQGAITYSFPSVAGIYPAGYGSGEPGDPSFGQISTAQQAVFNKAAQDIASFTNLKIDHQPRSEGADFLIAQSGTANPTAYTYVLGASDYGGDIWFGTAFDWRDPKLGDYFYYAHIHEFGHALGLKHGHETSGSFPVLPDAHDALEFTVMSYRSYPGASATVGLTNETYGFPSTYMIGDIRALQQLYGANFSARSGNTVYSWSPTTGETFIDGVGQGRPGGGNGGADANVIFMSVWDVEAVNSHVFKLTDCCTNLCKQLWRLQAVVHIDDEF